jgi:hypothetical protein
VSEFQIPFPCAADADVSAALNVRIGCAQRPHRLRSTSASGTRGSGSALVRFQKLRFANSGHFFKKNIRYRFSS